MPRFQNKGILAFIVRIELTHHPRPLFREDEYGDKVSTDLIGYYKEDNQILYYGNPLNEFFKELEKY